MEQARHYQERNQSGCTGNNLARRRTGPARRGGEAAAESIDFRCDCSQSPRPLRVRDDCAGMLLCARVFRSSRASGERRNSGQIKSVAAPGIASLCCTHRPWRLVDISAHVQPDRLKSQNLVSPTKYFWGFLPPRFSVSRTGNAHAPANRLRWYN